MSDRYRLGDHYIICDATGWKIRRSDAVQQWDGAWVHKDYCDAPHPLDYARTPSKPYPVWPIRPEPTDVFIEGTGDEIVVVYTISIEAGAYNITGSSVNFTNTTFTPTADFSIAANSQYVPVVFYHWVGI